MSEAMSQHSDTPTTDGDPAMAIPLPGDDPATLIDHGVSSATGEVIEPSRALALADFSPPTLGTGERFLRLAYRLGVPGPTLAAPFRKPAKLRLLATVLNPLPGNKMSGTAIRAGHFLVHGVKAPIAQIDFAGAARLAPPLERVVHSFSWLADLEAAAPREQVAPVAERVLAAWLSANSSLPSRPGKGPAWTVSNAGTRTLNWLVHAPLILSGNDKAQRARVLTALNDTARWLDKNVARAEDLLAEVAGWCGIVAAGLLLPDGKPRRLFGEAGLIRALGELVGEAIIEHAPDQVEVRRRSSRSMACRRTRHSRCSRA